MVTIDLESQPKEKKEYKNYLIERTLTTGKVINIDSWTGTKTKTKKDGSTETVPTEKIILTVQVGEINLSCWMNADIKKGSDPSYNTTSYNNLEALGLIPDFKEQVRLAVEQKIKIDLHFVESYFKAKLLNRDIKFVPETITPKDGEKYSVIQTIEGYA